MARITVEDCVDKFPSRFELVLVAAYRAKKLYSGELPKVDKENDKNTVIALREIADTSIPIKDMKENLISQYQTYTIVDEEEDANMESYDRHDTKTTISEDMPSNEKNAEQQIDNEIEALKLKEDQDIKEHYKNSDDMQQSEETNIVQDIPEENKIL